VSSLCDGIAHSGCPLKPLRDQGILSARPFATACASKRPSFQPSTRYMRSREGSESSSCRPRCRNQRLRMDESMQDTSESGRAANHQCLLTDRITKQLL